MKFNKKMSKQNIVVIFMILICLVLFTGCGNKSDEEALKWKTEYEKIYVKNQNLEGQLEGQKKQILELAARIERDQETIKALQDELENK